MTAGLALFSVEIVAGKACLAGGGAGTSLAVGGTSRAVVGQQVVTVDTAETVVSTGAVGTVSDSGSFVAYCLGGVGTRFAANPVIEVRV